MDDPDTSASTETFKVHLHDPNGCAVNTNYVVDADVRVTINDPDPVSGTVAPGPTHSNPVTKPTPSKSTAGSSPSAVALASSPSPSESPSPSPSLGAGGGPSKPAGSPLPWIIGGLVLVIGGGAGFYYWRLRGA
jgi:hypothetical protein